jgi:hypothetical protein
MSLRKLAAVVTIAAGSATLYSLFTGSVRGTEVVRHAVQDQQGGAGSFAAATPQRLRYAEWYLERYTDLMLNGMEPGTGGFHLLRPQEDSLWTEPGYTVDSSGGRAWWPGTTAKYQVRYSLDVIAERAPHVSFQKPIAGSIIQFSVVAQSDDLFRVDAHFDSRAVQVLEALIGTINSTVPYVDWFGITRQAGEAPTDMRAVVVADNEVYLPCSMLGVATGTAGPTVTVASDMDEAEALDLVVKLESS